MQKTKLITDRKAMQGVLDCGWPFITHLDGRMYSKHRDLAAAKSKQTFLLNKWSQRVEIIELMPHIDGLKDASIN